MVAVGIVDETAGFFIVKILDIFLLLSFTLFVARV
jgi:hypothetical protein